MWEIKPEKTDVEQVRSRAAIWTWVIAIALVLGAVGFGLWWWSTSPTGLSPNTVARNEADSGTGQPDGATVSAEQIGDGDSILRQLGSTLSPAPELQAWLAEHGLIRRLASAISLIADGDSPHDVLGFLGPKEKFQVLGSRHLYASPQSYARYDLVTRIITSIDAVAAGKAYRTIAPYLRSAYAEVGRPTKSFDTALREAIDKITKTSIPESEPELKEKGLAFVFLDPKLEGLSAAQKHLLRMGPTNARMIQRWLLAVQKELSQSP